MNATTNQLAALKPPSPAGLALELERALVQHRVLDFPLPAVGRYEVRRKLGEGGMAVVFEAFDPELSRPVALKVLRQTTDQALLPDMQHEARAIARVTDPAVVTVYDLGVASGQIYLCMALVEGGDAGQWLRAHGPVSWRRIVSWFVDAARGLHAAHEAQIVHRDFKLENLLIGADGLARITDFGLARLDGADGLPRRAGDASASAPPQRGWSGLVGTPGYIAPELTRGQPASPASDQYAFFVALDRALAFAADAPPPELTGLIRTGVDPEPARRHADLAVVRDALAELLGRRDAAGQRASELLGRRVRAVWIDGIQQRAVEAIGRLLPVGTEPAPEFIPSETHRAALRDAPADPAALAEALWSLRPGVLVLGPPGAGKTVHLIEVARALLERAERDDQPVLPVVLNLSSFGQHRGPLREWLQNEIVAKYALSRSQVVAWLEAGRLVMLLDGLDELARARREALIEAVNAFRKEHPLPYVVTCRVDEYAQLGARLDCELALRMRALADDVLSDAVARAGRADVDALQDVEEQLRNPLVLSLFLQAQGGQPGDAGSDARPLRERLFGATVRHALDVAPPVPAPERERALEGPRWLARTMERVGVTELWLEELQPRWLDRAWHRWLANGLALFVAFLGAYLINVPAAWLGGQPTSLGFVWGTASAVSAFAINRGLRIVPMEAMAWSWERFRKWVPYNVGMGVMAGLANGTISGEPAADATLGGITGLLGMSMIGLVPSARERRVLPNEGLRESARNAAIVAPAVGLLLFFGVGYAAVPLVKPYTAETSMYHTFANPSLTWGLTMGVAGGYATWLATGMWAPIAHTAVRLVLSWTTPLPLHLEPWLDGWARRDLLRRVGGGWMFRHETLRHWLAEGEPPKPAPPP